MEGHQRLGGKTLKNLWKFVKTSGIYFIGTVLHKLITFFLLPIYTKYIDKADMGTYDVANAYITFLCSMLFLDIWSGIMRFTFEYKGDERKKPINSGLAIFTGSTILYTIVMYAAGCLFDIKYLFLIYLYGILMNIQTLVGYLARTYGKNALYTTSGLVSSFVTVMCNILLIVFVHMDYSALFISACIGYVVNIVILGWGIRLHRLISIASFDRALFVKMFRFSIPLCMNSVAYWFLTSYNRVAITNVLGAADNGLYAIAGRFASFITLFTSCFNMAWQEMSYSREAMQESDQSGFYTKALNSYIKFLGMGVVILIPAVFVIFPIMINDSYGAAKNLVPYYLLATIASCISSFLGNIFTAIKKNDVLFYTTVVGSVINVISVHLLLPIVGVQGASIALFTGFFINNVIRVRLLKKNLDIKIDNKFLVLLLFLVIAVTLIYIKAGIILNLLSGIAGGLIMLWVFRDVIGEILTSIKKKAGKY